MRHMTVRMSVVVAAALACTAPLAADSPKENVKQVLRVRLDGPLMESPNDAAGLFAMLADKEVHTLRHWVEAIRSAAGDASIAGMVLIVEQPSMALAQAEELSRAIREFRATGKKVLCFIDYGSNLSYALASCADHITLAQTSELDIAGIYAEQMFFKGLLDKIGVQADFIHVGAYKGAAEPFTRTEPSKELAENINWLLDGVFDAWTGMIAEGRRKSPEEVRKLVDSAPILADRAKEAGLVDEVGSFATFKQLVEKEFGADVEVLKRYEKRDPAEDLDFNDPFAIFSMFGQMMKGMAEPTDPGVALIYVEGPIMVGKSDDDPFGGGPIAGSTSIRAALERARDDERVRAVVIRVDSPGGSAIASDIMHDAARRIAKTKPLIVSMGGVAASGGYYVGCAGDEVYAERSTITGSIGVVGGKMVWRGLFEEKLGITTTEYARGRNAGWFSPNRMWDERERGLMNDYMEDIYKTFKERITAARGDRIKKPLDDIAGGRVYTGRQALELGLVDRIGGLGDALARARSKASLASDAPVYVLPKASELQEFLQVLKALSGGADKPDEFEVSAGSIIAGDPLMQAAAPLVRQLLPGKAAEAMRVLRNLSILQRERVACFCPFTTSMR